MKNAIWVRGMQVLPTVKISSYFDAKDYFGETLW